MRAIYQRQRLCPGDIIEPQRPVEMRKERAAARWLPFQGIAKRVGLDREQHKPVLAREMPCRRLGGLRGGGEMHEPIGNIHRRAGGFAGLAQDGPFGATEYLVDQHGRGDAAPPRRRQAMLEAGARIV